MPAASNSEKMLHWIYDGGGLQLWKQYREERFDVVSIPMLLGPAEVFMHSRKPVRTLEDLKGLKLRTSGAWLEMAKDLGAASPSPWHPGKSIRRSSAA